MPPIGTQAERRLCLVTPEPESRRAPLRATGTDQASSRPLRDLSMSAPGTQFPWTPIGTRWLSLTREIRAENANLDAVRGQRQALDLKVSNLRPDHVDPDLLDEQVRATLNLAAPDEIVIMQPATPH